VFTEAETHLREDYQLTDNSDLMLSRANLFFANRQYSKCLEVTEEYDPYRFSIHSRILRLDPFYFAALPNHLCCLYELKEKNKLFLLAHNLADQQPDQPTTWFAVGVYYMAINKISEARRYFSKSSMMDPHFGPAWVGFAHSFAIEGEHEQAISAYTTAARLFQGFDTPLILTYIEPIFHFYFSEYSIFN
jgi:anaphase-promoting complex subunit 6